ncbi:MAG: diguanylate cyclase [Campylobacterales bacterium]|nr:diguanylate cyclase [Campylobacterales bacterium]
MQRLERWYTVSFLPFLTLILGIFFSLLLAWKSAQWIDKTEEIRFEALSKEMTALIHNELESHIQLLNSSAAFIFSSENITRNEWQIFAKMHNLAENFPSLYALGFSPLVEASKKVAYEEARRKEEGMAHYTIFPASPYATLFPVTYIEPLSEQTKQILGYDIGSEVIRRKSIEKALQKGAAVITPKIEFVQEAKASEKEGFVIYMPLYHRHHLLQNEAERLAAAKGVVYSAIKVNTLFSDILKNHYRFVDVEIYDGYSLEKSTFLYDSNPSLSTPRLKHRVFFDAYGTEWSFIFKANHVLGSSLNQAVPYIQLALGIVLSIIISAWIYALQRTRKHAYAIAKEKTKQLSQSEAWVRLIFKTMQEGIVVMNEQGIITECNDAAREMLCASEESLIGRLNSELPWKAIHEDGSSFFPEERPFFRALSYGEVLQGVIMGIQREHHPLLWIQVNASPLYFTSTHKVSAVLLTLSDITNYRKSKYKLEKYLSIIDKHVIISTTDLKGVITEVSEAFCKISGYSKEELIGANHAIVRHVDFPSSVYEELWKAIKSGLIWKGELKNRRKDGTAYWVETIIAPRYDEDYSLIGYTAIRTDITDKKRVEELSITDRLTGLYNRLKLDELFAYHLLIARRHHTPFSIILLDIDKFKVVNDTYGHQVGDTILQEFALCIKAQIRAEDIFGRWGGEEFLLLLPNSTLENASLLAEKLRLCVASFSFSQVGTKTASFGVATFHDGDDEKSMMVRVDEALYRAKENGRNQVVLEQLNLE